MLKVLLIDDNDSKLERLKEVLLPYSDRVEICECRDIVGAKRQLSAIKFDLVVLDIQLPNRTGDIPLKDGGLNILKDVHTRSSYKRPSCIVGLTEFPELLTAVEAIFDDKLWSIVLYEASSDGWAERLVAKVEYLLEVRTARHGSSGGYDYDLAILTALPIPEHEAVLRLASWRDRPVKGDSARYAETIFGSSQKQLRVVAVCSPQMGMPAAAVATTKLIQNFRPKYLAMVGIAAGVRGDVEIGDVLIADPCWDWGSGKRRVDEQRGFYLDPDPMPERLSAEMRALFLDAQLDALMPAAIKAAWPGDKPAANPQIRVGPCASGACVLADGFTIDDIKRHSRKLIGVEMETYGVMHAAVNAADPKPLAFSMKAVCDFGDKKKQDASQTYAAFVAANLLLKLALKYFEPVS